MSSLHAGEFVEAFVDDAVRGDRRPAIRTALALLDHGVPSEQIVDDLLAAAQREVGERWHRNELTVADEHVATGVSGAALDAVASEADPSTVGGRTVVACAEGDWHSLAAEMFGESLRAHGVDVTVLGASTPPDLVAEFLVRRGADSLAVSCNLPIFFAGVASLSDAAHRVGVPVIAGGRAMGHDARRALRLGADAWAGSARDAAPILAGWRSQRPITSQPAVLDSLALGLAASAVALGEAAFSDLAARLPVMAGYDQRQSARTREDLVFIVEFLAASLLVVDDEVFTSFIDWLHNLLTIRGVPSRALLVGLGVLEPLVVAVDGRTSRLLDAARENLG